MHPYGKALLRDRRISVTRSNSALVKECLLRLNIENPLANYGFVFANHLPEEFLIVVGRFVQIRFQLPRQRGHRLRASFLFDHCTVLRYARLPDSSWLLYDHGAP